MFAVACQIRIGQVMSVGLCQIANILRQIRANDNRSKHRVEWLNSQWGYDSISCYQSLGLYRSFS
jgi:hypothetical protein